MGCAAGEALDCTECVTVPSSAEAYAGTEEWEVADGVFSVLAIVWDREACVLGILACKGNVAYCWDAVKLA